MHSREKLRIGPSIDRISFLLLVASPLTTIAVSPFYNYDPINLIKLLVCTSVAFATLGIISANGTRLFSRIPRNLMMSAAFFVLWMLVAMLVSEAPLSQEFWGVFGRNSGFLTYFSLIVLLLSSALVQTEKFYANLIRSFVLTSFPLTLYALIQLVGMDPIAWSQMAPFATLGNINFSSAFFGLASIVQGVLVLHSRTSVQLKLLLVSFLLVNIFIILQTGSIQGVMIFIAGMGIVIFLKIRSILSLKFLKFPYLIGGLLIFILTFMALLNRGPLARFVFSETILYRFDYWFAGWAMTLSNPIFGLGLDSYGDYYREFRGSIATLRTNPDRITNTAHNIYLDLSSSGGFPLLFFYVLILALAFRASWRIFKNSVEFDVIFVSLFSVWIAYLLQAFISINQVGVGIWGWVFTGALVGYERVKFEKPNKVNNESSGRSATAIKKQVARQMPAGVALVSIATFTIGFFLAFIPFRADGSFRSASTSGSLESMKTASTSLGATAYHIALTLDGALKGSNEQEVREVADELISRYPRDFMGWRIRQLGALSTPKEREEATAVLERLDPFNPQVRMSK